MKKSKKGSTFPITRSLLWMPILTILLALIWGELILNAVIPEEQGRAVAVTIAFIVSFICCLITVKRCPNQKLLWSLGTAISYGCMLMLGNLLFFGVAYTGMAGQWCSILSAGLIAGFLPKKKRGKYA